MATLIDRSAEQLTPEMLAALGKMTGEKAANLQEAAGAMIPILLCAISSRAGTAEGREQLLAGMAATEALGGVAPKLESSAGARELLQIGSVLANRLFDGSTATVAQAVSTVAGISGSSAGNLLAVLTPLVLATVSNSLGPGDRAGGLVALLAEQAPSIQQALPPALQGLVPCDAPATAGQAVAAAAIAPAAATSPDMTRADVAPAKSPAAPTAATILPAFTPAAAAGAAASVPAAAASAPNPPVAAPPERIPVVPPPEPARRSPWRWLLPLLLLAVLGGLAWYFFRPQPVIAPAGDPAATATPSPVAATATAGAPAAIAAEDAAEPTEQEPAEAATAEAAAIVPATAISVTGEATRAAAEDVAAEATDVTAAATPTQAATEPAATDPAATAVPTATATPVPTATTAPTVTPPATAGTTFTGENAGVCTAIAAAQTVLEAGPAITAQTGLADLQTYVREIRTTTNALAAAASQRTDIDLDGVNAAFGVLEGLVNILPGATVGNAAATVNPALRGVRGAYANLRAAASCD